MFFGKIETSVGVDTLRRAELASIEEEVDANVTSAGKEGSVLAELLPTVMLGDIQVITNALLIRGMREGAQASFGAPRPIVEPTRYTVPPVVAIARVGQSVHLERLIIIVRI
jgi:hypothetical protein